MPSPVFVRVLQRLSTQSVRSIGYLGVSQVVTLLIPLLTTPWVLRALQPTGYGNYVLVTSIVGYGAVLIDFGFSISATQHVARIRDDRAALTRYFWTVQCARLILALIAVAMSVLIVIAVPKFRHLLPLTLAYAPYLVGSLLYPNWLFLGLERIRLLAVSDVIARTAAVAPIFLLVRSPSDTASLALIWAASSLLGGVLACMLIAWHEFVGGFVRPTAGEILAAYRDSWPLFVTRVSATLYSISNTVLLGLVQNSYQVGIFNAADKVRIYSLLPLDPFMSVFFPRISREMSRDPEKAVTTTRKLAVVLLAGMGAVSAILFLGARPIIRLLTGSEFDSAIGVLRILSVLPFIEAVTTILGSIAMVSIGLNRELARIHVIAGLVNVALLIALGGRYGALGAAAALTATYSLIAITEAIALRKTGLLGALFGLRTATAAGYPKRPEM